MLDRRVDVCDGRKNAVEQRGEQVVVFDDIIGKYGDGRVHWSRRGSALVGGHRVVWHVLSRDVASAREPQPCGSAGS
jgi:hypothetical protein